MGPGGNKGKATQEGRRDDDRRSVTDYGADTGSTSGIRIRDRILTYVCVLKELAGA